MSMQIPDSLKTKAEEIIFRYPPDHREAALVPLLFEAQRQVGWIDTEIEVWASEITGASLTKVREVTTFYSMLRTSPPGKYLIQFCQNISCCLTGGLELQAHVQNKLGIKPGETTEDGLFTLKYVECLGGCSWAPMMLVNEDQYFLLNMEKLDRILTGLKTGNPVKPDQPTPLQGNVSGEPSV
jgi:NADH-quinone oxidoreductase subunit E